MLRKKATGLRRLHHVFVPRLNLACLHPQVPAAAGQDSSSASSGGGGIRCPDSSPDSPDSPPAPQPAQFRVNHEDLGQQEQQPAGFNYPHIFRKEFYEHAEQASASPASSCSVHPQQQGMELEVVEKKEEDVTVEKEHAAAVEEADVCVQEERREKHPAVLRAFVKSGGGRQEEAMWKKQVPCVGVSAPPSPRITPEVEQAAEAVQNAAAVRHRSYFNPKVPEECKNPGENVTETELIVRAPASSSDTGSSSTCVGEVHHECICSRDSSGTSGNERQNCTCGASEKKRDEQDEQTTGYDPFSRMWETKVARPAYSIPEPPPFEKHLPGSIVSRCNKEPYAAYSLEANKKTGGRPDPGVRLQVDEQIRSSDFKSAQLLSPVWPTIARTKGSQFSTGLEDERHDKHYVRSGRYDVLPVPTYLGSRNPPLRLKGEDAIVGKQQQGADVACNLCPEPRIATELLEKIAATETDKFDARAALRKVARAKNKGMSPNKMPHSRSAASKPTTSHPRFQQLCGIEDPCCFTVAPRKVGKQVDEKWLALKRRRPSLSDLWVLQDQCPQVCAPAPVISRPPPPPLAPWDGDREEALIWEQRVSSCRAAFSTMAVYDSYRV